MPQRFEPGPNERLIDPVAEFPTVFAREIRRTMQAEDSEGALRQAVEQIITGCRRDGTAQTVISRDGDWVPYDFDRTHLLNLVAGLPLRRNWDIGVRFQYQSGKPETITAGYNAARGTGYLRFDARVDKRAVWRSWLLDFYVDITNVALLPEEVQVGTVIRYVLPTVGLRGRF